MPEEQITTKKERAEAKRAEKEQAKMRAKNTKTARKYAVWVGIIVVVGGLLFWGITVAQKAEENRLGEHYASEGRDHIQVGDHHDAYKTNPPTSGPHAAPIQFGIYNEEVIDENAVHNLEHGGIWITYKDITEPEREQLESIARKAPNAVLLSPRSANDHRISVASWQRLMHLDEVDVEKIEEYIRTNINKSPEPLVQ